MGPKRGYFRPFSASRVRTEETTLANTLQAKKRARQNEIRRARNAAQRSGTRTAIKKVLKAVTAKDKPAAQTAYRAAVSQIDRAAGKGLHHHNTAARLKSRLNQRIRALA